MFAHSDDGLFWNQGHNDWLQAAAEGGIGFAAVLAALAVILSIRAFRSGWGFGIVAVFLLALVDFPLQKPVVSLLLFTLAGAVSAGRLGRLFSDSTAADIRLQKNFDPPLAFP